MSEPPSSGPPSRLGTVEQRRLEGRRARGLTLWSIAAILAAPFATATSGATVAFAAALVVVAVGMQVRGFDARRPIVAGVLALVIGAVAAGVIERYVLRPAEVKGHEAVRQDQVERVFDHAFDRATDAPQRAPTDVDTSDAGSP